MQDLIRVGVADAGEEPRVDQRAFGRVILAGERLAKLFNRRIQQLQPSAVMRREFRDHEVDDQREVAVERYDDPLPQPADRAHGLGFDRTQRGRDRAQDEGTVQSDSVERLSDDARPQALHIDGDVRQFWHANLLGTGLRQNLRGSAHCRAPGFPESPVYDHGPVKHINLPMPMEYHIRQYGLQQGALEIQYIEEFFGEFPRRKTSAEVVARLQNRDHQIVMAEAALPDDPGTVVPVAFKVSHELRESETDPKLADLVQRLAGCVTFNGRRVLYSWIGGTRRDWRGQGFFRALTEQQEAWALDNGFDEVVVKTKNKFYAMRGTLDHLEFDVIQFEPQLDSRPESKVYLSKRLGRAVVEQHGSTREVVNLS